MAKPATNPRESFEPLGVVGLGLMGQGITACLIACGFTVVAFDRSRGRGRSTSNHVNESLQELVLREIVGRKQVRNWRSRLKIAATASELAPCRFVIETVTENLPLKRRVHGELEEILSPDAVIASNTSSFPITLLQKDR